MEHWKRVLVQAERDGDAHYAIDMIVLTYEYNGWSKEMLAELEAVVQSLPADHYPSRALFARYRLAREYLEYKQPERAKLLAQETLAYFLDRPFPKTHAELCLHFSVLLAHVHLRDSDFASARATIEQVAQRWPGHFTPSIEYQRNYIDIVESAFNQEADR